MADKILNDNDLENVSGGEALASQSTKEYDEQILGVGYITYNSLCPKCKTRLAELVRPGGKITCRECGYEFSV